MLQYITKKEGPTPVKGHTSVIKALERKDLIEIHDCKLIQGTHNSEAFTLYIVERIPTPPNYPELIYILEEIWGDQYDENLRAKLRELRTDPTINFEPPVK